MDFTEVSRHGAYGSANKKKKELESVIVNRKVYIFKDISNGPFTNYRTDQYVVAVEQKK